MKPTARRRARECVVQVLYSWQLSNNNIIDIEKHFLSEYDISDVDVIYFHELYVGTTKNAKKLDKLMTPYLSRKLKYLDYVEHAILLIALFELSKRQDIPLKVTINEAIELAKIFGAEASHKFVNGVLNKVALEIKNNLLILK